MNVLTDLSAFMAYDNHETHLRMEYKVHFLAVGSLFLIILYWA